MHVPHLSFPQFILILIWVPCLILNSSQAQPKWSQDTHALEGVFWVEDVTKGLRFDPPLISIAESSIDPNQVFVGTHNGRIFISRDGGDSWIEDAIRTDRISFLGSTHRHQSTLELDKEPFLKGDIAPSPGQVFSFQTLIDLDRQLPQAGWIIQRRFDQDVEGGLRPKGFLSAHTAERSSWRLNDVVEDIKGFGIGVDWHSWVADKSVKDQAIQYITPHSTYPDVIFAATEGGLHRSLDAGDSWPSIMSGGSRDASHVTHVKISPLDVRQIWAGTKQGLRISYNGGETFEIPSNPFVNDSEIRWISFHPQNPMIVYVGLSWGMLKTTDHGATFDVVYYESWPALSSIRAILIDPYRPHRIILGTDDGLMLSEDDGTSYRRIGGLLFMEKKVISVIQGFKPGHHFAATQSDIWQTFDGGQTWSSAFFGDGPWKIQRVIKSASKPYSLWVLTYAEILRLTLTPPEHLDASLFENLLDREYREPQVQELIDGALERAGVHPNHLSSFQKRAPWSQLIPEIQFTYAQRSAPIRFQVNNYLIGEERSNFNDSVFDDQTLAAFAWWDLSKALFHPQELDRPRGLKKSFQLATSLRNEVISLFKERRQLLRSLTLQPRSGRALYMRLLRLEELTVYLNMLCHGRLPPISASEAYVNRSW